MSLNTSNEFVHELIDSIFIKEFNQNINSHILTKIYSLKFLIFFRLQIPMDWLEGIINMVITICNLPDQKVLNDAALLTLEKILYMKDVKSTNISVCDEILKKEELYMNVINCLTEIISKEQDSFAMKCFFRTIFLTDSNVLINKIENFASITNFIVELIVKSTDSKEQYSYYFFEAIAIIMTKLQRRDPNSYKFYTEKIRQSIISMVGGSNIEVMGYGFQLVSFMMYYDVTISDLNVVSKFLIDNRTS